uniref:Pentatricopeptide repeat-containing protein n=1 Tax=Steinernema glaseri TaxID=37863 RepID=A0A1I7YC05_9BILA
MEASGTIGVCKDDIQEASRMFKAMPGKDVEQGDTSRSSRTTSTGIGIMPMRVVHFNTGASRRKNEETRMVTCALLNRSTARFLCP